MSPRVNFADGQEVIFQDLNAQPGVLETELYDRAIFEMLERAENSFFAGSLKVTFVSGTSLSVAAGLGFQTDNTQTSPEPTKRPIYLAAPQALNLNTPDPTNGRIDKICVKATRADITTESRFYKDPISTVISSQSFVTRTDWAATVQVVTGTPAGSPTAPATPSGYMAIATVLVHAIGGVSGQGDITDLRTLMPIAANATFDTTSFQRATQGVATPISTVLANFDAYLKQGYQNYTDFDDLGSDPASPAANKVRLYCKSANFYFRDEFGAITALSGGGGSSGGTEPLSKWTGDGGTAPIADIENGSDVWLYSAGLGQKLTAFFRIPLGFIAGGQIFMRIAEYSPSTSNTILLQSTASLIRQNVDAVSSTTNQRVSTNTALTNAVANRYRTTTLDLTSSTGTINGVVVNAGDLIRIDLARGTDTDTADVRFIPSATEVQF